MINKIGILKLENCGNILSLKNSFEYCGASIEFIENRNDFKNIDKILIPGVGSFPEFKKNLKPYSLICLVSTHLVYVF